MPYEQRPIAKDHQNRLGAVEDFLRSGIEDRAGWCSDPFRTAQYGAVKIRYSASVGPGVHFPGFFGRATAQLHDDLAAEGGFNAGLPQQLSRCTVIAEANNDDIRISNRFLEALGHVETEL